ncbi:hypothetical protein [Streptomyces tibetensis]|uniref:hypothetical protein n=1 Tax=Streptomyces tibetensis TaxID=2382123 RepID=UPI003401E15B
MARCNRHRPAGDGIEIFLPYADYHLVEGILRELAAAGRRPGDRLLRGLRGAGIDRRPGGPAHGS